MPPNTVYVGRPTKWGNPWVVRPAVGWEGHAKAVGQYRANLLTDAALMEEAQQVLGGKNLACWCPLDHPCHADVLLEVANANEIYACRLPPYRDAGRDTVRVLAKLPADKAAEGTGPEARQTLEKVLDGWLVRMELPGGLRWVRQRLLPMTKDAAL